MFNFLTKKTCLLFYIVNGMLSIRDTKAEPPVRNIPVVLQAPGFQNHIVQQAQSQPQSQIDDNTYLVNYFLNNQQQILQQQPQQQQRQQILVPANSYVVNAPAPTPIPGSYYAAPPVLTASSSSSYSPNQEPTYQTEDKKYQNYKSKSKPFTFTVTNVTTNLGGRLDLPFGERSTLAFTYPPIEEMSYTTKNQYSQSEYGNNENQVKFNGEPAINFGSIVSDTFVLKERTFGVSGFSSQSHHQGSSSYSPPISASSNRATILNGILNTVIEKGPRPLKLTYQTPQQEQTQKEEKHSPGDLIAGEIPVNGKMDFSGLNNLTEYLIEDAAKFRPNKRQYHSTKEQVPMFVAVQFNTVGRNKFKTYDQGAQKNVRIHVVLGHKHFSYKNIKNLNELYDYVRQDYEPYQPSGDYGFNYFNAQPKFRISKTVIDLIIEFVEFSWKIHQDTYTATELRGKDITRRIAKLLRQSSRNRPRFRPNKFNEELPTDFFTWAYTNTLGYRTLV